MEILNVCFIYLSPHPYLFSYQILTHHLVDDEYTARRSRNNDYGAPSVDIQEIIQDPRVAIEKGWSLLSYVGKAAVDFGRYASDNYVKPAASQLADPNFRGQVRENVNHYMSSFTQPRVSFCPDTCSYFRSTYKT